MLNALLSQAVKVVKTAEENSGLESLKACLPKAG